MNSKILYVEDEAVLAKVVKEGLEKLSYQVAHASNGQEGLELYRSFQPDLCILDVMMPIMDGFTLGKEIKRINATQPIIYLTAKSTTDDVIEGFSSGGNDYLKKPFSMQELHARIQNLLHLTGDVSHGTFEKHFDIGNNRYDVMTQILSTGKKEIMLTHREHELLMKLVQSNKEIVNRREILKDIWGDDSFFHSRNLDVYIRKLRTYFAEDEDVQIITLKGVGYRFVY